MAEHRFVIVGYGRWFDHGGHDSAATCPRRLLTASVELLMLDWPLFGRSMSGKRRWP
jgi:hypothetical protein